MELPFHFEKRGERPDVQFYWKRNQGDRVVIVIDDEVGFLVSPAFASHDDPSGPPLADLVRGATLGLGECGLFEVFYYAQAWTDTMAVGFFFMPAREDKRIALVNDIQLWINSLRCDKEGNRDLRLFFLVDGFFGNTTDFMVGPDIINSLKGTFEQNSQFGYLSRAGVTTEVFSPVTVDFTLEKAALRKHFQENNSLAPQRLEAALEFHPKKPPEDELWQ